MDAAVVETHVSALFFDLVSKRKKPVDFGFLDFRLLAARRRAWEEKYDLTGGSPPMCTWA